MSLSFEMKDREYNFNNSDNHNNISSYNNTSSSYNKNNKEYFHQDNLNKMKENSGKVHSSRGLLQQAYFNNAPKIMLETISARTATIVLCLTYLTFALAFLFDLRSTLNGFQNGNQILSSETCSSQGIVIGVDDHTYGCTLVPINYTDPSQEVIWVGHVRNFENVISVALQAKFKNITGILYNQSYVDDDATLTNLKFEYDVDLYGCYKNSNCGEINPEINGIEENIENDWKLVISTNDNVVTVSDIYQIGDDSATLQLLSNTFQNQETLPDNGKIKSYIVFVTYRGKQPFFQSNSDLTYKFANINRSSSLTARILLQFCVFFTLIILGIYIRALKTRYTSLYHALPEQRWILFYIIALILFQNPVYCVITWSKEPSANSVYSAYIIDAAAQASFFTLWLILSDGWKRQIAYYSFYLPKIFMGLSLFGTNIVILTLQFPSISPSVHRSSVEAVDMWNYKTKISLIAFSMSFLFLLWIWVFWWLYNLFSTGRTLSKLPYMSTRYLQLWFRFYSLQATLVTLYYLFQYFVTVYFIVHYVDTITVEAFADGINTLFRQQSLLFGKVIFLTVYALILVFFFLPAGFLEDNNSSAAPLTATYVIYESEIQPMYRTRSRAIRKMKTLNLNQLAHANPHVLCIDLALEMLELSWQAYNDPKTYKTESGYGIIEVDDIGYTLLNHAYDSDHDTVCFIFRHKVEPKIVICFRGTCSKKHWSSNLKYKPYPVNLESMKLDDLDELDGLSIPVSTNKEFQEGQSHGRSRFDIHHLLSFDIYSMDSDDESSDDGDESNTEREDGEVDERRKSRKSFAKGVTNAATKAATMAVDVTTGMLTVAAAHTPGLEDRVQTSLHSGFWEAYCTVRSFIHTVIRQELSARPANIYCTGHSLGGALATIASLDLSIHTIPRINKYLKVQKIKKMVELVHHGLSEEDPNIEHDHYRKQIGKIKLCLYTFGAPRVGNSFFAQQMNHSVPNSFRIVVDGDIVSGVPKTGFKHSGTEIIIDSLGAGSIIIDPSFVEKFLRTQNKTSMSVHSLTVYRRSLQGVKAATEYIRKHATMNTFTTGSSQLSSNDNSTARENALIAAQMRLALESGIAAIKSALFLENHKQTNNNNNNGNNDTGDLTTLLQNDFTLPTTEDTIQQYSSMSSDHRIQQEKHDLDVMETDEIAKNVKISQRNMFEVVADYTLKTWSYFFNTPQNNQDEDQSAKI